VNYLNEIVGKLPLVFWYLQGSLTLLIAVITVNISRQQSKTNERRLRLETYDRGLRVWEEVRKVLGIVTRNADISTDDLGSFMRATAEADFLFDEEIPAYIEEMYRRGLKLWSANKRYKETRATPQFDPKVVDESQAELTWFTEQYKIALAKFKKYLNVRD
jgi:hypothetical protein